MKTIKGVFTDPNYRALSVISLVQACVVTGGVLAVSGMVKIAGYGRRPNDEFSFLALFVRQYGLLIFAIPIVWMLLGIWIVRRTDSDEPSRWWQVMGVILSICGLIGFASVAMSPVKVGGIRARPQPEAAAKPAR